MLDASGLHCAVLGDPIAHSLSPVLHRAAYAELGLDWSYDAVRVPSGGLAAFLASLDETWRGLSLTMPLKREVLALGSSGAQVSTRAELAGGANTVVLEHDGAGVPPRLVLDNTDLPGAAAALREHYTGAVRDVTVIGAGATAASVGLALCDLGAVSVRLLARDRDRAAATVAAVARHPSSPAVEVADLATDAVGGEVVVSTIPASAQDDALLARCAGADVVFEALYEPWPTPLAAAALGRGQTLVSGLDLLVHQAVLQVEQFTGAVAPLATMRAAGERALSARGRR